MSSCFLSRLWTMILAPVNCSSGTTVFFLSASLFVLPLLPPFFLIQKRYLLLDLHLLPDTSYSCCHFNIPGDKNSTTASCSFLDLSFPVIIFSIWIFIHSYAHILDIVFQCVLYLFFLQFPNYFFTLCCIDILLYLLNIFVTLANVAWLVGVLSRMIPGLSAGLWSGPVREAPDWSLFLALMFLSLPSSL